MDTALDRLSLVFGRPIRQPFGWITSVAWWATFILAMLSIWPDAYGQFAIILRSVGVTMVLPASTVVISVLVVFTVLQMTHGLALKRRDLLLERGSSAPLKRSGVDGSELNSDVPWLLQKNRHMWLVVILAVASFGWVIYQSEVPIQRAKAKCDAHDASHRVRPDQVIDCPTTRSGSAKSLLWSISV